ncbi:MAG: glycerol-3-phosphate 1-O-acyltransferase PlsY [Magnetococcales bacterium]|nr:glycerol-3-phosphate 1-O-acyltransferase PlsY [Magnetococcales bacterium]
MTIHDLLIHSAWLLSAYLLGAVPFGLLVARLVGAGDIRQQGSGNIGATNVLRTAGRAAGALALLLDMLKGFFPVLLARLWLGAEAPLTGGVALAVFLGHLYPVYLGFRGGKGVATGLGVYLAWVPLAGGCALLAWMATALVWRISSLAALLAFLSVPVCLFFQGPPLAMQVACILVPWIFWRHRTNIQRLLQGTEPRIGRSTTGVP